jgi:hypothetical protein
VVDQTAGSGNDQIPGASQEIDLASHVGAANEENRPAFEILSVLACGSLDLTGQLAGGGKNENLVARAVPLGSLVAVKGGQEEAAGFARTSLGDAEEIPSLDDGGDGLPLDRGGGVVFEVGKSAQKIRIEAKGLK